MEQNVIIGKRILEVRKERRLSQQTLAFSIGVTQKSIDFWEKGINEPKASYIANLAKFFGVSIDFLVGLEE